MKAEERKHLKENELAERVKGFWSRFSSGSTTANIVFGAILLALALVIGWRYYSNHALAQRSQQWTELEQAESISALEKIIKDNPGTLVARTAKFDLSRVQLRDSLMKVASENSSERTAAADTLSAVRSRYAELAKESVESPQLVQESMMEVAKIEEILSGIPKADAPNTPRGTLDAAMEAYDALAKKYPESYLGKQAAKRYQDLSDHKFTVRAFYDSLMEVHGKPVAAPGPALPEVPKLPSAVPTLPEAPKPATVNPVPAPAGPNAPKSTPAPSDTPKPPESEPKPKSP